MAENSNNSNNSNLNINDQDKNEDGHGINQSRSTILTFTDIESNNVMKRMIAKEIETWTVDNEYALMSTKFEFSIMFMTISPYILILSSLSLLVNKIIFRILTNKYDYKIQKWHHKKFPILFFFCALLFQQFLISLFFFNVFGHVSVAAIMVTIFGLSDITFVAFSIIRS